MHSWNKYVTFAMESKCNLNMKTTEFLKKAAKAGCYFVSHGKEHDVWYSPVTGKYFRVWRHGSKEIKGGTLNSMMKDAGLK